MVRIIKERWFQEKRETSHIDEKEEIEDRMWEGKDRKKERKKITMKKRKKRSKKKF